jgi:hypothetical protein
MSTTRSRAVVVAVAGLATLAGCSSSGAGTPAAAPTSAALPHSPSPSPSPAANPATDIDNHVRDACRAIYQAKGDTGDVTPTDPNLTTAAKAASASANFSFRSDGQNLTNVLADYQRARGSGKNVDFVGQAVIRQAVQLATDCKNGNVSLP